MQNIKRWISLALVVCLLAISPAAALAEGTSAGTGLPAEGEMIASPSPSIEARVSPSPSAETSSAPTDAAEVKTIISFEAVAPEGLSVPHGTLETGLDLPASLNAQFSDGAAGGIPVTWQCAAGYDPNAEAGAQFAFAAVLPQGYAFSEGVSLPEILVTLTPTPVNTMLMAQASDEGWTLSDGKLTVTGEVYSEYFSYWNDVQSIEVTGGFFALSDGMSFSGTITVLESGYFYNYGNVSGTISVESSCYFMNNGTISGGMVSGSVYNHGTIEVVVTVDGKEKFVNYGADILETLGASPTSLWYRVNADGTRALVREGDTFASLQKTGYKKSRGN